MRSNRGVKALAGGVLLALVGFSHAQQGMATMRGVNGEVRLTGFTSFRVEAGGLRKAIASGPTLKLEDTGQGITLTGKAMSVTLRTDDKGLTHIVSAEVSGGADAVIDTNAAKARKDSTQTTYTRAHIVSDRFTYTTQGETGLLDVPQKLAYDSTTSGRSTRKDKAGKALPTTYTQTLKVAGSSAKVMIGVPTKSGDQPTPQSGQIRGPVNFDLLRVEKDAEPAAVPEKDEAPTTTHVYGSTDLLTADFVSKPDPFLTADGNVIVNGDQGGFKGTVTGTQAVITLDRNTMLPKLYEFSGEPATTTIEKNTVEDRSEGS